MEGLSAVWLWAGEMVQRLKVLEAKAYDLSFIPGTHMEKENKPLPVVL